MTRASVVYTIFGLLHLIGILIFPGVIGDGTNPRTWGFHFLLYFPTPVIVAAYGLYAITLLPGVQEWLVTTLNRLPSLGNRKHLVYIAASTGSVALLWLLRQKYAFLGDGHVRASELDDAVVHSNGEAYIWLILAVSRALDLSSSEAYQIFSTLCGLPFVYLVLLLADRIAPDRLSRLAVTILIAGSGLIQLYAGYVEIYPPLPILILLFVLFGLHANWAPSRYVAILIGFCGVLVHPLAGISILPSIYLVWRYDIHPRSGGVRFTAICIAAFGVVFALSEGAVEKVSSVLLPVWPTEEKPYGLLTLQNLLERMNGVALAAPASFPLILLIHRQLLRSHLILVILAAAGIAGLLAFDFILGSLDWDLMSLMSFPLVILFAVSAARLRADMRPNILIPACVICVLNTLPWIVINNTDASIRRLEDITLTEPANYFESHSRAVRVAVALREEGFSRAAVDVLDRASTLNPDDTVEQINRASIAREIDDFETTAQAAREVLRTEPWNLYAYRFLRGSLEKLGHHNELRLLVKTHSERLVLRGKGAYEEGELTIAGMAYSGAAFMDLQNPGSLIRSSGAGKLLVEVFREAAGDTYPITFDKLPRQMRALARRAYNASDKEAAVSYWAAAKRMGLTDELIHQNQGVALIELGRNAEGLDTWRAGIRLNPGSVELRYILGTTLRENGEVDEAKQMLHEAIALEPTSARHYLQMGLLLQATERKEEAIQFYKDALVKISNYKDLEAALDAIQK